MSNRQKLRQFVSMYSLIAGCGLAINAAVAAESGVRYDEQCSALELDAGLVSTTLEEISTRTGMSIVVDHRLIDGVTAPAISGAVNCTAMLEHVLSNVQLEVQRIQDSTLVISKSQEEEVQNLVVTPPPPPPVLEAASMQDIIVVTSTGLFSTGLHTASPVVSIDGNELGARGTSRVEDFLKILPAAFASQTTNIGNGSNGASNLNLRNLGSVRTLVLIDGRRLPYGAADSAAANLDLIPPQLIERIDIVTGGASAVYGSDALAGVANFIMRRDFEGIEFDGQVGVYQDANNNEFSNTLLGLNSLTAPGSVLDGRNVNASILFGADSANGRGNVTAFFGYQDQDEIRQDARDYSTCALGPAKASPRSIGGIGCTGSSTFRRFFTPGGDFFQSEDGSFTPYTGAPEQTFNFAPDNFIQRPVERFSANAFARYEITDILEAHLDFSYTQNHTDSQLASSGSFFRPFSINCDNPFLNGSVPGGDTLVQSLGCDASDISAGTTVPLFVGYRNVTGDPRNTASNFETFRVIGGLRGTIDDILRWETFGQYSRTKTMSLFTGDVNFSKLQDAFLVVDNGAGPVCRSGNLSCIPFNIFQRGNANQNLVSREAARSIQGTGVRNGSTELKEIGATLQGDLGTYGLRLPWAVSGVKLLVGTEWREDSLDSRLDSTSQLSGANTGLNGARLPVIGSVNLWELFMETHIPLVEEKSLFEELSFSGAYRYSDYVAQNDQFRNNFLAHTYSAGLTWVPFSGVRFRGQFQRAVRAPNVIEMFTGLSTGFFNISPGTNDLFDPCAGDLDATTSMPAPTATASQCAFTGVSAAQYGTIPDSTSSQLNLISGGNPLLTPEKADTYTAGFVFAPSFLSNFTLSVDYFDITVNEAVSNVSPAITLRRCLETGISDFCNLVSRDALGSLFLSRTTATGELAGVSSANVNIGKLVARGLDIGASYKFDLADFGLGDWGVVDWVFAASHTFENSYALTPEIGRRLECAGFYSTGCFGPNPKYQHRLVTTWASPWDIDFDLTWRYLSAVESQNVLELGRSGSDNLLDGQLDAAHYVDLAAHWYLRDNVTLRFGVQNVFGRDPELQTLDGSIPANGNTFPGTYDPTGRYMFFGMTLRG